MSIPTNREYNPDRFPEFLEGLKGLLNEFGYSINPFDLRLFMDEGVVIDGFTRNLDGKIEPVYYVPNELAHLANKESKK